MMSALPMYRAEQDGMKAAFEGAGIRQLYQELYRYIPDALVVEAGRAYLDECLEQAGDLPCDLPEDWDKLEEWMTQRHEAVGQQYLDYLAEREAGAPRRYFGNRSHALYFLQGVAPTKFVDGSWLYGLLPQWRDDRYRNLIRIYLEELGEGRAEDNHVAMYRKLLATNGCEHGMPLSDEHYVQGAIQMCLAGNAAYFLPEVVGFNLGYEQLPLHLLITTHELKELGIDAYYFQVHVTVDNAGTGHARKALESVRALCSPGDEQNYYSRVRRGYCLNDLGAGTVSVIASFDLQAEVTRVLAEKSVHGRHMHSDYCKVAGRTVNEWLTHSGDVPDFLRELERHGWIKRHCDPAQSRFWRLIEGECADMFGVFSGYERQVIYDWISGDWQAGGAPGPGTTPREERDRRRATLLARRALRTGQSTLPSEAPGDFGAEMRRFEDEIMQASGRHEVMDNLTGMMSPAAHHTPVGLMATRMFSRMLDLA
ncbi:iron-containing redox enzyme family protein [Pusillimonas sp.]|uniref:iron-containing redox enzyme family protein n=1 Tax=Pusillimonas sp. TaxID=3040095 RepID=UPI0029BA7F3A|nr:iron-containing redox enzyme family protein [Pusillimonas sp.]MDX3893740.1 iron-containing redox enzyme family protein [Pusillimonas sp.]